ncbi:MAG: hypothetical protein OXN89_22410 [Bryobacterales bacterium]|nr:hypothetical protein [Bryobacterales bacterium]
MRLLVARLAFVSLSFMAHAPAQQGPEVERLRDPVTAREVLRYASPHHETHHYYFVSPWSPGGDQVVFFQFDDSVEKLTATERYPGALVVMNADGTARRELAGPLAGHYHTGVNQLWGPDGQFVYFQSREPGPRCMARVRIADGETECVDTPVPCSRLSPDGSMLSCGNAEHQGVLDLKSGAYRQLVTLAEARDMTPSRLAVNDEASQLQNTRFSPDGEKLMIVHRTRETFPRLVEVFVYGLQDGSLRWLADNLHHPSWRPDSMAVLFVRHDPRTNLQWLVESDIETGLARRAFDAEHVPAGHPSYHPLKPHLVVTDCYGGRMGNGLALINLKDGSMTQLVTIPLGSKPEQPADERFPFRNWGIWFPPRQYLNEPRPVWNDDGSKLLYTSEESGRMNLYVMDTSDL